jgi:hypothetical protein
MKMASNSNTTQLEIDTSAHIDERGVEVSVYIGANSCEPSIETIFDFEKLIENHFEGYTIGDMIRPIDIPDAELLVIKLEQMAKYARNTLEDYWDMIPVEDRIEGVTGEELIETIADPKPNSKYFA